MRQLNLAEWSSTDDACDELIGDVVRAAAAFCNRGRFVQASAPGSALVALSVRSRLLGSCSCDCGGASDSTDVGVVFLKNAVSISTFFFRKKGSSSLVVAIIASYAAPLVVLWSCGLWPKNNPAR